MHKIIIFILCVICTSVVSAADDIELIVIRSEHKLLVVKNDVVLNSFRAAFGSGGRKAKLRRGDHTTPKGVYRIKKMRDSERFHSFLQLDYPSVNDAITALASKIITKAQYNAILDAHIAGKMPPQNTPLGGSIGIHGIGIETQDRIEIHQIADWTQGCIALRNDEVDILKRYIKIGTEIIIVD
ncbi:MAG: L,D-transpeptidase [Methylophaga sp.]|nr:L,D-transpeptidase [Methylophaga sp.]